MTILELLDQVIAGKRGEDIPPPVVNGIAPSPFAGRKSLYGSVETKGIQRRGRVARAINKRSGREFRRYRDDSFHYRDADPEYAAINDAASGGDEVAKLARDDYHEERGGQRLSHVHETMDRSVRAANRYDHAKDRTTQRTGFGGTTRGSDAEYIRNIANRPDKSTKQNRRERYATEQKVRTPYVARLYPPPAQKSLYAVAPSPFLHRKSLGGMKRVRRLTDEQIDYHIARHDRKKNRTVRAGDTPAVAREKREQQRAVATGNRLDRNYQRRLRSGGPVAFADLSPEQQADARRNQDRKIPRSDGKSLAKEGTQREKDHKARRGARPRPTGVSAPKPPQKSRD